MNHLNATRSSKFKGLLQRRNRKIAGFSLVETAIALGIVGFALVGIVGMVPVGLGHFRKATSLTSESNIIKALSNDIGRTSYDQLRAYSAYFDHQGMRVEAGNPQCIFTVQIEIGDFNVEGGVSPTAGKTVFIKIKELGRTGERSYPLIVSRE